MELWSIMESVGAVFLPKAGERDGLKVKAGEYSSGTYWATTADDRAHADCIRFYATMSGVGLGVSGMSRYYGYSVRFVQNVK